MSIFGEGDTYYETVPVERQEQPTDEELMKQREERMNLINLKTGEVADPSDPVQKRRLQMRLEKRRQRFRNARRLEALAQTNPKAYQEMVSEQRAKRNMKNWEKRGYNPDRDQYGSEPQEVSVSNTHDNNIPKAESNDNFGNEVAAQYGFHGYVDKPTRFLAGEAGRERINIHEVKTPKIKKQKNSMFGFEFGDMGENSFNIENMYNNDMFDFNGKGFGINGGKNKGLKNNFGFNMEDIFRV